MVQSPKRGQYIHKVLDLQWFQSPKRAEYIRTILDLQMVQSLQLCVAALEVKHLLPIIEHIITSM